MPRSSISLRPGLRLAGSVRPGLPSLGSGFELTRAKDQTLKQVAAPHLYLDAEDSTFSHSARVGHTLIHGYRYNWSLNSNIVLQPSADFNNRYIYHGTTSTARNFRISPSPFSIQSFTLITCALVPQSLIDAINAGTAGQKYFFAIYDLVANNWRQYIILEGGSFKGWRIQPYHSVAAQASVDFAVFPACKPSGGVPFILAWKLDAPSKTTTLYFNDGTSPITTIVHTAVDLTESSIYLPMTHSPNGTGLGWVDDMACLFVSDDRIPANAMTDAQRIAIMADWRAWYGIP